MAQNATMSPLNYKNLYRTLLKHEIQRHLTIIKYKCNISYCKIMINNIFAFDNKDVIFKKIFHYQTLPKQSYHLVSIVWFQKFSILPPRNGLFLRPPPQPLWKLQSSFIHLLKFWGLNENPQPANNFQTLL